jgi:superfamily II DNA or RNA helicase
MNPIVVYHDEFALSIGEGEDGPAPPELVDRLMPRLTYTHVERCTRHDSIDPTTGERRKYKLVPHDLYRFEHPVRRLACQPGYLDRVVSTAEELGYAVDVRDIKFTAYPDCRPEAFEEDWDRFATHFKARPKQDDCVAAIADHRYGLIDAAPAFGKTYVMAASGLLYPKAEILLTVPSEPVMLTSLEYVSQYLPAGEIGLIGGGNNRPGRFTICIINSLMRRAWELRPDILLIDEVHGAVGDKQSEALAIAARRARVYGFSGSLVKRFDGAHARLEGLCGQTIFKLTNQEALELGLVVPIHVYWEDVILPGNPASKFQSDIARKRHGIWYNNARNDIVAGVARRYPADTQVLILVETVAHAFELARRLPDYKVCVRTISEKLEGRVLDTGIVDASRVAMTDNSRRSMIKDFMNGGFNKLIANDTLSTGFSPNALSVLIRADGRKSDVKSIQVPGRVGRTHAASGKQFGVLHDFLDQFDTDYQGAALDRRRCYHARGFKQFRSRDGSELVMRKARRA